MKQQAHCWYFLKQRVWHFIYFRYALLNGHKNCDEMNFDTASDCTRLRGFPWRWRGGCLRVFWKEDKPVNRKYTSHSLRHSWRRRSPPGDNTRCHSCNDFFSSNSTSFNGATRQPVAFSVSFLAGACTSWCCFASSSSPRDACLMKHEWMLICIIARVLCFAPRRAQF